MEWTERVRELQKTGASLTEIALAMQENFPELNAFQVMRKVRTAIEKQPTVKTEKEPPKPKEIVIQNLEPVVTREKWNGCRTIRFGLMGDTQINSKYTQITHLHTLYDIYAREGIKTVYHTGDMDEGEQMRQGHQYECYTQGADDHTDEIIKVYPKRTGITTHFITGNHDASMIKHCGYDIGRGIAEKRGDMKYLGRDCAIVEITPNCTLELRHPWDGSCFDDKTEILTQRGWVFFNELTTEDCVATMTKERA